MTSIDLGNSQPKPSALGTRRPLRDRFPMLRQLEGKPRRPRVPHVQQNTAVDCGCACLTSVLRFHGLDVSLETVREVCGDGRDGTSALVIAQAAEHFGLRSRGVSVPVDKVSMLPTGTILHWGFRHFVVHERLRHGVVELVDPFYGPCRVPLDEFKRMYTGVALLFEKTERFSPASRHRQGLLAYGQRILAHRELLSRIVVTSALMQVFGLGLPILTGMMVDRVIPWNDTDLLQVISYGAALVFICQVLTSLMRSHLLLHLRTQVDAEMTLDFVNHLVDLPYAFFQRRSTGDLIMRLNSNTTVREILTSSALSGALDGSMVIAYLVVIMVAQPLLGALVLVLGLARISIFLLARRRFRDLMSQNLAVVANSQAYQVEMFSGMETLKVSGAESRAVEKWSGLFVDTLNVSLKRGRLNALFQALLEGLAFASPMIVLLVGGLLVIRNQMSLGEMLAVSALSAGFLTPLGTLISTAVQVQEVGSYTDRLSDVLSTEPEQDLNSIAPAPVLKGRIALESVTFRYSAHVPPAVQEVSLEIMPGEMVAIVGRSAAGKSTIANLLMALYRPESGRILFDDCDLARLDLRGVRRQIGIVTQHPFLFGASIRENIALPNPNLSMEDVERAAKLAHIHEEILQMPMGYDTLLVDGGQSLSGGQRQRLALARALVGRPRILVLDEATSALDADTERCIQESIAGLECTRVVIAHRLSTIRSADQILVMEAGRIVERGCHEHLLSRTGVYRELLERQVAAT